METNVEIIDDSTRTVTFRLSATEVKPHYERAYLDAQKTMQIQGFRRGKVPMQIIKHRFGKQIEQDHAGEIANEEFRKFLEQNNVNIMGQPSLTNIEYVDGGIVLEVKFQVIPVVKPEGYKGLTLRSPQLAVTDNDVDAQVDKIRFERHAVQESEVIEDTMYYVEIGATLLDDETQEPAAGEKEKTEEIFLDGEGVSDRLKDDLAGKKKGDVFQYVAEAQNDEELPLRYNVRVVNVKKVILPELVDSFVQEVTKGRLDSVEALRNDVKQYLEKASEAKVRQELEGQIVSIMNDLNNVEPPAAMIDQIATGMWEDFLKENRIANKKKYASLKDRFLPRAKHVAVWELLSSQIMQDESLEVLDEDIAEDVERLQQNFGDTPQEKITEMLRQNDKYLMGILHKKVFDLIISEAHIVNVEPEEYYDDNFLPSPLMSAMAQGLSDDSGDDEEVNVQDEVASENVEDSQ